MNIFSQIVIVSEDLTKKVVKSEVIIYEDKKQQNKNKDLNRREKP